MDIWIFVFVCFDDFCIFVEFCIGSGCYYIIGVFVFDWLLNGWNKVEYYCYCYDSYYLCIGNVFF